MEINEKSSKDVDQESIYEEIDLQEKRLTELCQEELEGKEPETPGSSTSKKITSLSAVSESSLNVIKSSKEGDSSVDRDKLESSEDPLETYIRSLEMQKSLVEKTLKQLYAKKSQKDSDCRDLDDWTVLGSKQGSSSVCDQSRQEQSEGLIFLEQDQDLWEDAMKDLKDEGPPKDVGRRCRLSSKTTFDKHLELQKALMEDAMKDVKDVDPPKDSDSRCRSSSGKTFDKHLELQKALMEDTMKDVKHVDPPKDANSRCRSSSGMTFDKHLEVQKALMEDAMKDLKDVDSPKDANSRGRSSSSMTFDKPLGVKKALMEDVRELDVLKQQENLEYNDPNQWISLDSKERNQEMQSLSENPMIVIKNKELWDDAMKDIEPVKKSECLGKSSTTGFKNIKAGTSSIDQQKHALCESFARKPRVQKNLESAQITMKVLGEEKPPKYFECRDRSSSNQGRSSVHREKLASSVGPFGRTPEVERAMIEDAMKELDVKPPKCLECRDRSSSKQGRSSVDRKKLSSSVGAFERTPEVERAMMEDAMKELEVKPPKEPEPRDRDDEWDILE